MLASVAEIQKDFDRGKSNMITNTAAYTIVAIAYAVFAVATWMMFTM